MVLILKTRMKLLNSCSLIHNINERVKDELSEKMKITDALVDILQLA